MITINKSNVKSSPKQTIQPNSATIGNQLIFGFCLKGRSSSGFFLRKTIRLKFTRKKVMSTPKTVALATIEISPRKSGTIVKIIVIKIAIIGVLCFEDTLLNPSGNALSLAIPYIILEVTIIIIITVLAVAKRAIKDIMIPPVGPKTAETTLFKGAEEEAISSYGKILTTDMAVKQYKTVVMMIE